MRRFAALIIVGVLPLVGCGSTSESVTVSATTRAEAPTLSVSREASGAPYRFVKPPLVVMSRRKTNSRAYPRFRVMARIRPNLPRRTNPDLADRYWMEIDGAPSSLMGRVGDECYIASFDLETAASGGPQNPVPEIFKRPEVGAKVTVSVFYRSRGHKPRSFSTEAMVRRPSLKLWNAIERLGAKQQGCKLPRN